MFDTYFSQTDKVCGKICANAAPVYTLYRSEIKLLLCCVRDNKHERTSPPGYRYVVRPHNQF